jgi:hypothetical protein
MRFVECVEKNIQFLKERELIFPYFWNNFVPAEYTRTRELKHETMYVPPLSSVMC